MSRQVQHLTAHSLLTQDAFFNVVGDYPSAEIKGTSGRLCKFSISWTCNEEILPSSVDGVRVFCQTLRENCLYARIFLQLNTELVEKWATPTFLLVIAIEENSLFKVVKGH